MELFREPLLTVMVQGEFQEMMLERETLNLTDEVKVTFQQVGIFPHYYSKAFGAYRLVRATP